VGAPAELEYSVVNATEHTNRACFNETYLTRGVQVSRADDGEQHSSLDACWEGCKALAGGIDGLFGVDFFSQSAGNNEKQQQQKQQQQQQHQEQQQQPPQKEGGAPTVDTDRCFCNFACFCVHTDAESALLLADSPIIENRRRLQTQIELVTAIKVNETLPPKCVGRYPNVYKEKVFDQTPTRCLIWMGDLTAYSASCCVAFSALTMALDITTTREEQVR